MVETVPKGDIERLTHASAFPYADYLAWDEGEPIDTRLFMLSTSLVEIRPRKEWNKTGREVYERAVVAEHADAVTKAFAEDVRAARWLVRHSGRQCPWFPEGAISNVDVRRLREFLERHVASSVEACDDGFIIEDELSIWLSQLIDYAFLLKRREVEFVGLDFPLLVVMTHHLDVQIFSTDGAVLDHIEERVGAAGVRTQRVSYPPTP